MKTIYFPHFLMDEANPGGSGGGGGNPPNPTPNPDPNKPAPTEAEKERDRLLAENTEVRKKARANEDALNALKLEIAELKKAGAKGSGDWKAVADQLEETVKTLTASNENLKAGFKNTLVSARLREEAMKQGAKADMVDLIDSMEFSEIEFNLDEQNMKFNLKGVDTAVANLKKLRPSFFDAKKVPDFNGRQPGAGGGAENTTLESAKTEYLAALKEKHKNPARYEKAFKTYQEEILKARKAK